MKLLSKAKIEDRLLRRVEIVMPCDCWLWTAAQVPGGYGNLWINGKMQRAHRLAYESWIGPIPDAMHVLHKCDIPACINPSHLFLGTPRDNARDRTIKGRNPSTKGERNASAKLSASQIVEIRNSPLSHRKIGVAYGISHQTVGAIKRLKKWTHIN